MPFDGTGFSPRAGRPPATAPSDNMVTFLIVVLALCLLVTPFSISGLIDIVQYVRAE